MREHGIVIGTGTLCYNKAKTFPFEVGAASSQGQNASTIASALSNDVAIQDFTVSRLSGGEQRQGDVLRCGLRLVRYRQRSARRTAARLRARRPRHRLRETAKGAAVASLAPSQLRGSAFGLLATVQSVGNLIASSVAVVVSTSVSPTVAFIFLVP